MAPQRNQYPHMHQLSTNNKASIRCASFCVHCSVCLSSIIASLSTVPIKPETSYICSHLISDILFSPHTGIFMRGETKGSALEASTWRRFIFLGATAGMRPLRTDSGCRGTTELRSLEAMRIKACSIGHQQRACSIGIGRRLKVEGLCHCLLCPAKDKYCTVRHFQVSALQIFGDMEVVQGWR